MNRRRFILFVVLVLVGLCLYFIFKSDALPIADLYSPSQEVRDAAAKILRAKAKPSRKSKWLFFTHHLRKGETETNVLELLRSYNLKPEPGIIFGGLGEYAVYRLDYYWALGCVYDNNEAPKLILASWKLIPGWAAIYVKPPTNYTGVWITYYANGQKLTEGSFTNGFWFGEHTTFRSDGSKSDAWHYDHGKPNGLWAQYYPSGQIQAQCQYSNAMRVGDMVWYHENGLKQSTTHYDDGKRNGSSIIYFPSGKIQSQCEYSNNTRVGLEIKYNEDGATNSVQDHSKL